jgi:hypothetical protein
MTMPAEIRMEVIQRELWVGSCGFTAAVPEDIQALKPATESWN